MAPNTPETPQCVLQRAVCALIASHPNPAAFSEAFALMRACPTGSQISRPHTEAAAQALATVLAQELVELASDAQARS